MYLLSLLQKMKMKIRHGTAYWRDQRCVRMWRKACWSVREAMISVFWMMCLDFGFYRASWVKTRLYYSFNLDAFLKPGWEDIVVFHIGQNAPLEYGVKAAFNMPHLNKQVWLEAEMSSALKMWLVDIPGVAQRNQQVQLHAISPDTSWRALWSASSSLPMVNGA